MDRVNSTNTQIEELHLEKYNNEIQEQFYSFLDTVPFIQAMVSQKRPECKDLPRDEEGRAIIDLTHPPLLRDMDYFRPAALHYMKYGNYTNLKPNKNPNSEYGKWLRQEIKRCWYGMVRPEDGMWITGYDYFYLNYCPIQKTSKKGNITVRSTNFPDIWDGQVFTGWYINNARQHGHHASYLSSRGRGKSFRGASMLARNFFLGENEEVTEKVQEVVTAAEKKYLTGGNQVLDMFQDYVDFLRSSSPFARQLYVNSPGDLVWRVGYKEQSTGIIRGAKNAVIGITSKDGESKLRGTRGQLYIIEEFGSFPRLLNLYQVLRPSLEQGNEIFGLILAYGTSGDNSSDFSSAQELIYNPIGYNEEPTLNVFDKAGQGRKYITWFYPAYLNYSSDCIDKDGNSNVTKALLNILVDRYNVKYNTTNVNAITKRMAEYPIVPQEAIMKSRGNMFPIVDLTARLNQLDNNPHAYDDVYVGGLVFRGDQVEYQPTGELPIRDFPLGDNKDTGAIEFYKLPEKGKDGKVPANRYIMGHDPVDDDSSGTLSLTSTFVLDLWTDRIVAEYTGRQQFADDNFEIVRKLCLFYNAKCLYEAHPYSQKVITPDGVKLWRDIKVGDRLFSTNGRIVNVKDIPVDEYMPIYKITLADGREVMCSDNHIWNVYQLNKYVHETVNLSTKDLRSTGVNNKHRQHNFFIPNGGAVEYPHKDVPIDPYAIGLLIAEGAFTKFKKRKYERFKRSTIHFSSSQEDASYYKTVLPYPIKYIGTKGYSWHMYIDDIDLKLEELGLLHKDSYTKFIPDLYKYNDSTIRLEILKGLMDGDGCAAVNGAPVFVTTSKALRDDIMELCRSLGMNCKVKARAAYVMHSPTNDKEYNAKTAYRISIYTDQCIFKLPRKVQAQHVYTPDAKGSKAFSFLHKMAITKIEFSHYEQGKCVTVDSEDGLYMVGDYVVTHNCNKKGLFAYFKKMNSLYLLADTPEYLKDRDIIKTLGYGNTAKGVGATLPVNNYANSLIRDWLLKPTTITVMEDGEPQQKQVSNLYTLLNRALIKELILFDGNINVDRVRALGMCMLYREQFMIMYGGDVQGKQESLYKADDLTNDPYFISNYDAKYGTDSINKAILKTIGNVKTGLESKVYTPENLF